MLTPTLENNPDTAQSISDSLVRRREMNELARDADNEYVISNRTTDRHALSQRVIRNNLEDNAAIIRKMVFEFPQLVRIRVCIHSFDSPKCFMPMDTRRRYACASYVCTSMRTITYIYNYRRLYSLIGPGQASSCLASSFAYLTTEENSSVWTTRIAWFGLISSLNRDISRLQPSADPLPPHRVHSTLLHFALTGQHAGMRNLFLYLFLTRNFLARNITIKYIRFIFHTFGKYSARFLP